MIRLVGGVMSDLCRWFLLFAFGQLAWYDLTQDY